MWSKLGPSPGLAVGALVALSVLFFWRITLAGEVVYWGTPLLQFYPWRQLAAAQYHAGHLPLWNPYSDFGAPLAANFQTAAFSPLNLFYLVVPVEQAMGFTIVLHVAIAGMAMYGCAAALGLTSWGAALAALAYMFSGYLISRAGFLSIVATVPWLPALVAGAELTLRSRARGKAAIPPALGLALATGLLLVAGHIQLAFYSLLVVAGYTLVRAVQFIRTQGKEPALSGAKGLRAEGEERLRPQGVRLLLPVAGAVALGIGLAGVQLAPSAELALHSARQAGPGYDLAMNYSLWPGQLVQLLAPDFFGNPAAGNYRGPGNYWEGISYIGVAPLLLALFAARHGRHPARSFLLGLTLVALVFALGRFTPVFPWVFTHVPGFGLFQAPARFLLWSTFAGALLAGIGLDTVLARPDLPALRRWAAVALAGSGGLGIGLAAALAGMGRETVAAASLGSAGRAAALLLATAIVLRAARDPARTWWPAALCGLLVIDLFSFGITLNPTTQRTFYTAPWPPDVARLRTEAGLDRRYTSEKDFDDRFGRVLRFKDFGSSQWEDLMPLRSTLLPNLGQAAGLHEVFNYDPLKLERSRLLRELVDTSSDPGPLLSAMGVRWIIGRDGTPRPAPEQPLPRAYRVDGAGVVAAAGRTEALAILREGGIDPRRRVVLEGAPTVSTPGGPAPAPRPAVITAYGAQEVVVTTSGEAPGALVLADSFYPGWRATVDGQPAAVYAANVAFRGVLVPPGDHTVVFQYDPASVRLGLAASFLSLLCVLGLGGWAVLRHRAAGAGAG